MSLLQARTLPSRVVSSNRARHELIQLPTIIKVRLLGTRRQSGTVPVPVPDLAGDGDAPPSPSPICPESGTLSRPRPRFGGDGDAPPSPIPIGGSAPCPRLAARPIGAAHTAPHGAPPCPIQAPCAAPGPACTAGPGAHCQRHWHLPGRPAAVSSCFSKGGLLLFT